ncbi:phosphohistidine phosphatase [Tangfeifania diversioriginum]|uniref:Phosphohistidine phosphatase n=1 Tax=Tangfeifania diversioriginum TaxID=1168035 RepID=A0A1M6CT93_9BACT|nr:histidine phosphatase family protein [Tangfeifania diversioriginum]SHI64237.1 phosphohistidine phosphatase [Tangfeifania diversioriginum]
MKRVVIVRHAKAVPYGYEDDFNRDLRDRGKNDAKLVSEELNTLESKPDAMISSPAKRALKTARIFAEHLEFDAKKIREIPEIYDGLTTSEFVELIQSLDDNLQTVFFFGHNPDFHMFTGNLLKSYHDDMPTCATVGIDFQVGSWKQVEARTGENAFRLTPKMFK